MLSGILQNKSLLSPHHEIILHEEQECILRTKVLKRSLMQSLQHMNWLEALELT